MRPFVRKPDGYVAILEPEERAALGAIAGDVAHILRDAVPVRLPSIGADAPWSPPGWTGPGSVADDVDIPVDPAVLRLLPGASQDDEVATEFRRLTQSDIADEKVTRLAALVGMLETLPGAAAQSLVVRRETAEQVAGALTDVRLVLAERLGIRSDVHVEALYRELSAADDDTVTAPADDDHPHPAPADDTTVEAADEEPEGMTERQFLGAVFVLAGALQESLVDGMLADLRGAVGGRRTSQS